MAERTTMNISLDKELALAIRQLAARERRNLSQQVEILLEGAMRLRAPKTVRAAEEPPLLKALEGDDGPSAA